MVIVCLLALFLRRNVSSRVVFLCVCVCLLLFECELNDACACGFVVCSCVCVVRCVVYCLC